MLERKHSSRGNMMDKDLSLQRNVRTDVEPLKSLRKNIKQFKNQQYQDLYNQYRNKGQGGGNDQVEMGQQAHNETPDLKFAKTATRNMLKEEREEQLKI